MFSHGVNFAILNLSQKNPYAEFTPGHEGIFF